MASEDEVSKQIAEMSLNSQSNSSHYHEVSAKGASRQHNGDVHGNVLGDIHNNHIAPTHRTADPRMDLNKANEKLLLAAANGHIERVMYLIHDCNADRNYSDANGLTAVHWAALSGYEDVLEGLVRDGADVDELSVKFGTPLCLAALKGHKHIIQVLLTRRASPLMAENRLGSAIHCAAWGGDSSVLELILEHAHKMPGNRQTYFDFELPGGRMTDFEAAEALAKAIAGERVRSKESHGQQLGRKAVQDVKQTSHSYCTPLSVAASGGKVDTVSWLLSKGADPNAASSGIRSSTTSSPGLTPLSAAAQSGSPEVVQLLVDYGARLQWPDADGVMALRALMDSHCAFASASPDQDFATCARIIISLGADASALDQDERRALTGLVPDHDLDTNDNSWEHGNHATQQSGYDTNDESIEASLHAAAKKGRTELVRELIRRGADLNTCDEEGRTILMQAIDNGHLNTAEAILDEALVYGGGDFDIDAGDYLGDTAISLACDAGNVDLVRLLLSRGASPNIAFLATEGPLFIACRSGDEEIGRVLLEFGADVSERLDDGLQDGRTPLHEAAEYGEEKMVKLLLAAGANCNALDSDGRSPLSYAVEYGMKDTVAALVSAGADHYAAAEDPVTISSFQQRNALGWIQEHGNISSIASAVAFGELEILQLFQKAGCDLQHYALGMPMLHLAIICGKFEIARYLINQGADVHTRGDQGLNAYDLIKTSSEKDAEPIKDLLLAEMAKRPQHGNGVPVYHSQHDRQQAWSGGGEAEPALFPERHVLGKVVVLQPFSPWSTEQLELQTGDHVSLTEELANDWWRGISNRTGLEGIFPESHVDYLEAVSAPNPGSRSQIPQHAYSAPSPSITYYEVSSPRTPIARAIVVYPYIKTYPSTLELFTNDAIDIVEYVDHIWWKGRSSRSNEEGMFPCSHVQLVDAANVSQAAAACEHHRW